MDDAETSYLVWLGYCLLAAWLGYLALRMLMRILQGESFHLNRLDGLWLMLFTGPHGIYHCLMLLIGGEVEGDIEISWFMSILIFLLSSATFALLLFTIPEPFSSE